MKNTKKKNKYWYVTQVIECVLCGRQKKYKWRVYKNPSLYDKLIYEQDACGEHFM
jgi:hypothetical protein